MMERELQQNAQNKENEEAYKVKKTTHDLLPNADENITKLKVSECTDALMIFIDVCCLVGTDPE